MVEVFIRFLIRDQVEHKTITAPKIQVSMARRSRGAKCATVKEFHPDRQVTHIFAETIDVVFTKHLEEREEGQR